MKETYNIFGKMVVIEFFPPFSQPQIEIVKEQFKAYSVQSTLSKPDVKVNIGKLTERDTALSVNPSLHHDYSNGFQSKYPKLTVEIIKDQTLTANLILEAKKNPLINYLKKLNNIQYCTIEERITQVLYELVLVPLVYFDKSKFLVHSSAFKRKTGGAVLIGGTGGVGKTSLEIELCMNRGYSFIADDISVVDNQANIWPNLSYPKIYSYNLKNNNKLKNRIFRNRTFWDKMAWRFKLMMNGPSGVRRTISPIEAYGSWETKKNKIDKYYILIKRNVEKISVVKINGRKAAEMSLSVMQAEYYSFNNHILWHDFNSKALNKQPILNLNEVFDRWSETSLQVFDQIDCYMINIPLNIAHKEFTNSVSQLIENN